MSIDQATATTNLGTAYNNFAQIYDSSKQHRDVNQSFSQLDVAVSNAMKLAKDNRVKIESLSAQNQAVADLVSEENIQKIVDEANKAEASERKGSIVDVGLVHKNLSQGYNAIIKKIQEIVNPPSLAA